MLQLPEDEIGESYDMMQMCFVLKSSLFACHNWLLIIVMKGFNVAGKKVTPCRFSALFQPKSHHVDFLHSFNKKFNSRRGLHYVYSLGVIDAAEINMVYLKNDSRFKKTQDSIKFNNRIKQIFFKH